MDEERITDELAEQVCRDAGPAEAERHAAAHLFALSEILRQK